MMIWLFFDRYNKIDVIKYIKIIIYDKYIIK